MSGTIGILALETGRYTAFTAATVAAALELIPGSKILCPGAKHTPDPHGSSASDILNKQNLLARSFVGNWLWLLGDDHDFGEDALLRLLARDVDIVCPLNVMRRSPFGPMIYDKNGRRWEWDDLEGKSGLIEVPSCGNAGMLVKRRVFDKIGDPWFEWAPEGSPYHGGDLAFFWKARQAGFKVHVDLDVVFGHTNAATVVPVRVGESGKWATMLSMQGDQVALMRMRTGDGPKLFEQVGLEKG